jgi:hypothetical protein
VPLDGCSQPLFIFGTADNETLLTCVYRVDTEITWFLSRQQFYILDVALKPSKQSQNHHGQTRLAEVGA